ncbi:MAG: putative DNA binding domain-containing protein [Oscillospiraceae bacterium]|jgi:ATP-dependent DNA helicase RecG|nr:putative DNA binding domain-containing protein [Oscillospiraceae bacterium]
MAYTNTSGVSPEHQNVDWKEKWDDEFLKWICGFANGQGGRLEIGRNNDGVVVSLPNFKKLLDDLPNKIKSTMGILPAVNLCYEDEKEYIVIEVLPHPNAISYHGRYYLRMGSTNQELTGNALDEFLLRKYGKTWDSAPIIHVSADDLDLVAFRYFRKKSLARGRLTQEDLGISDAQLLETLKLVDGDYLKRAAILTFHEDPEKWVTGAYIKIGYFKTDDDLVFQDEVHGSLILMPDKVVDLLYDKYFKGLIHYEGLQRVEKYPVHPEAMREAVLNAIVHKDYSTGNPIQIRVYDDKVTIYNAGALPVGWSLDELLTFHTSEPRNPAIASTFFRSGLTEAWGRGIEKIVNSNTDAGKPKPQFEIIGNGLRITFATEGESTKNITANIRVNKTQKKILEMMLENPNVTAEMLSAEIGITERNIRTNIKKLRDAGLIDREGEDKNGYWMVKEGLSR